MIHTGPVLDGTYGGTTGVSRGPALQAEDRSTATLVGCTLVNGGWLRLQGSSTILLFGCTIRADAAEVWETEVVVELVVGEVVGFSRTCSVQAIPFHQRT